MIPKEEKKAGIIVVKELFALVRGTTSKHQGDFYWLNWLNETKFSKKICKNSNFCRIVMSFEKNNIVPFNQYMKSDKMSYIIHVDLESLFKNK